MSEEPVNKETEPVNTEPSKEEPVNNTEPKLPELDIDKLLVQVAEQEKERINSAKQEAIVESSEQNKALLEAVTKKITGEYNKVISQQQSQMEEFKNQMEEMKSKETTEKGLNNMNNPNAGNEKEVNFFDQMDSMGDQERVEFFLSNAKDIKLRYNDSSLHPYGIQKK